LNVKVGGSLTMPHIYRCHHRRKYTTPVFIMRGERWQVM